MDRQIEEELLSAWMSMSLNIRGNRLLTSLSFNEIVVCSFLYRNMRSGGELLTATDLCNQTKLLKSQLNKVLNDMEKKGLVERIRSVEDKRKLYLRLREEKLSVYLEEHAKVMHIVHRVCDSLGDEKVQTFTGLIWETLGIMEQYAAEDKQEK